MIKGVFAIAIAVTFSSPVAAVPATTTAHSYEECHALAVSRGVRPGKRAERYTMLKGFNHKTNPQGLIARCMAGKKI
jgi:hypothetical protein